MALGRGRWAVSQIPKLIRWRHRQPWEERGYNRFFSSYEKSNSEYWKVITKIINRSLKNWARYARYSLEKSILTMNTSTEVLQKMYGSLAFLLFSISTGFVDSYFLNFCLRGRAKKSIVYTQGNQLFQLSISYTWILQRLWWVNWYAYDQEP